MLDIGSWEFLLIIVLGIVVIGPKELPGVIRTVGGWVRRAKDLAREFQSGLEDIARETELDKFRNELESEIGDGNAIGQDLAKAVDPDGEISHALDYSDGDWYSDHEDDTEDDIEGEDREITGPTVAAQVPEAPDSAETETESEPTHGDAAESNAKTGA